jgi:GNAT superfamily N-acetyltransferase
MTLPVRVVLPEDASSITELSNQLGYPVTVESTRQNIEVIMNSENDAMWVAFSDKKIAGWIHVFKTTRVESGTFGEIGGLVVDEGCRRKGVGKLLVEQVKEWCTSRNIPALRVRCNSKRKEAHIFYSSLRFVENKEQKVFEIAI